MIGFRRFLTAGCHVMKSSRNFTLSGIYPPVVTPFEHGTENIDFARFERLLKHLDRFPLAGFVILGSNGEFPYLSHAEKVEVVKQAKKILGKDRVVIAGAGAESTRETITMVQQMADVGADATLVFNPFYYKSRMTTAGYVQHFSRVADKSPIPVVLYNVPANTGLDIPVDAIVELAKHKNIVGIKESGGDVTRIANIIRLTSQHGKVFNVVAGSASFLLPSMQMGVVGAISALANVLPAELCQLQFLFKEGKFAEARELQMRLIAPNTAVTAGYGVPGVKSALRELHGIDTGTVRSPLLESKPEEVKKLVTIFKDAGFHK